MKIPMVFRGALLVFCIFYSYVLSADVIEKTDQHFRVKWIMEVEEDLDVVFEKFVKISSWWSPSHTFEGDVSKFAFDLEKQALVETIEGGFVKHSDILYWKPRSRVVLKGGIGPLLSEAVTGVLVLDFKEEKGVTTVAWEYSVYGYVKKGTLGEWADAVEYVLIQQSQRLRLAVEEDQKLNWQEGE